MKKLVVLLLLMVSTNVFAEWTRISQSDAYGGFIVYVDLQSIRKEGSKVRMWDLFDMKKVQQLTENTYYLSTLAHSEYDCNHETMTQLDNYSYSENMVRGEIVASGENLKNPSTAIRPGTQDEALFKTACSKK